MSHGLSPKTHWNTSLTPLQTTTYSEPVTRMYGAALGTAAAQGLAVSASDFSRVSGSRTVGYRAGCQGADGLHCTTAAFVCCACGSAVTLTPVSCACGFAVAIIPVLSAYVACGSAVNIKRFQACALLRFSSRSHSCALRTCGCLCSHSIRVRCCVHHFPITLTHPSARWMCLCRMPRRTC